MALIRDTTGSSIWIHFVDFVVSPCLCDAAHSDLFIFFYVFLSVRLLGKGRKQEAVFAIAYLRLGGDAVTVLLDYTPLAAAVMTYPAVCLADVNDGGRCQRPEKVFMFPC